MPLLSLRGLLLCGAAAGAVLALPRAAQAAQPTTLTQALAEAYENNATLQEQRASLRATDETVPTALSGWRPTVTFSGTAGQHHRQRNGGKRPDPLSARSSTKRTSGKPQRIDRAGHLTQPVYSGGKVIASTREAKNSVYAARAQLLATEQTVFLNVVTAYVTVITDEQVLALDQSNQQVLEQQLLDTNDQFKVGEITLTSVAQAQAALAQAKEQVEIADGNLQIARENFRELVGDYPGKLTPPQPLVLPVKSKDQGGQCRPRQQPECGLRGIHRRRQQGCGRCRLLGVAAAGELQASAFNESNPVSPGTKLNGGEVLGRVTVPLYQGGAEYSAIRQARAHEQQSFATILDMQRTAYAQATQAWVGLVSSRAAIVSTNAEIKANAIALDGTEREQLVGTRTTLDVLNAQQLLLNSQVQQVRKYRDTGGQFLYGGGGDRPPDRDRSRASGQTQYDDLKYYDAVKYAGFGTGKSADRAVGVAPDSTLLDASGHPIIADEPTPPKTP